MKQNRLRVRVNFSLSSHLHLPFNPPVAPNLVFHRHTVTTRAFVLCNRAAPPTQSVNLSHRPLPFTLFDLVVRQMSKVKQSRLSKSTTSRSLFFARQSCPLSYKRIPALKGLSTLFVYKPYYCARCMNTITFKNMNLSLSNIWQIV